MGILDTIKDMFSKNSGGLGDALQDGKLDMSDLANQVTDRLDSSGNGQIDAADLDVNKDGATNASDFEAAKDKLSGN